MGQMAYHHREILGTFDSAAGRRAWNTLTTPIVFERAQTWTRRFSFSPLTTNTIRVVADTSDDRDMSVSELRFFRKDTELPRSSSWRLEAGSNPWEVQRAFDGSNVTWWTSGRQVEPGTWIGVTFGAPVLLDTVVVDQIVDQRWTGLHLEATINGEWRTLRTREEGTEHQPRPDLRMALSDELKRQGIRWILIPDSDPAARDLRDNAPYWGITDVAEANGYRLWRID